MFIKVNQQLGPFMSPGHIRTVEKSEDGRYYLKYIASGDGKVVETVDIDLLQYEVVKYTIEDIIADTAKSDHEAHVVHEKLFFELMEVLNVSNPNWTFYMDREHEEDFETCCSNFYVKWGDYHTWDDGEYASGYGVISFKNFPFAVVTVKCNNMNVYLYDDVVATAAKGHILSWFRTEDFVTVDLDHDITYQLVHAY